MFLLDVNALIALVDQMHTHHNVIHTWFKRSKRKWATCPITENGFVRVLSLPSYPSGPLTVSEALRLLGQIRINEIAAHEFWPDSVSIVDESLVRREMLVGTKQVTDAYLLALAKRRDAQLVTFDKAMPWQAIVGGRKDLLVVL